MFNHFEPNRYWADLCLMPARLRERWYVIGCPPAMIGVNGYRRGPVAGSVVGAKGLKIFWVGLYDKKSCISH